MADRPILFSAPMVLALLAGRKTQTRRILKPQPFNVDSVWWTSWRRVEMRLDDLVNDRSGSMPYRVGDRLWVRETWCAPYRFDWYDEQLGRVPKPGDIPPGTVVDYLADDDRQMGGKVRPSLFMPRWASRLTLLVTDVRVERLQDISEGDAAAEGVELESADPPFHYVPGIWPHSLTAVGVEEPGGRHAARSFAKLWGHINGPESWQANPWVVAVTFSVHARNIDQLAPIAEAAE